MSFYLDRTIDKTWERADREEARRIKAQGEGFSDGGLVIVRKHASIITKAIKERLDNNSNNKNNRDYDFIIILKQLPIEVIALASLITCINSTARGDAFTKTAKFLGIMINGELWARELLSKDPNKVKRIEKAAKRRSTVKRRLNAFTMIARREGFEVQHWGNPQSIRVGAYLINIVVQALPDIFEIHTKTDQKGRRTRFLRLTEEAYARAHEVVAEIVMRRPAHQPMLEPPPHWHKWYMGGERSAGLFKTSIMRTPLKETQALVRSAIMDGGMNPAVDALNSLQAVPYRINDRVFEIIQHCRKNQILVSKLPGDVIPKPPHGPWEEMTDEQKRGWRTLAEKVQLENYSISADHFLVEQDMQTADILRGRPFYMPMSMDWRGRIYPLPHFHFQREDRVRAMFLFANGAPIGERGLYWLKVHVANCGDFGKISKRPIEERVAWVDRHAKKILAIADDPIKYLRMWRRADKPFLFLAAALELCSAMRIGPQFVTTLPVSFDGSCSGLQHLSALTRDAETARAVNLVPTDVPNDIYSIVADDVSGRLTGDDDPLAKTCLDYGVSRKLVKRNVMTYNYSSPKFGMAQQQQADLMDELNREVLKGNLVKHPFAPYHKSGDRPSRAARYIAGHIFDAIAARVHKPTEAMKFLQKIAKALAHEGKPVRWVTPSGVPWLNKYLDTKPKVITLWLHDKGVAQKHFMSVIDDNVVAGINRTKAVNSISPNFVHALDAAHLTLTVNAAVRSGITDIATVHDSFSCLAPYADRYNEIIREEFVAMYKNHNPLAEILECAKRDLSDANHHRLPKLPEPGTLNLEEIKNARYSFA